MFNDVLQINPKKVIIKDILTSNIKAAHIFEKYDIDFCCKGNRPLKEVCDEKNINIEEILTEINSITNSNNIKEEQFDNWSLTFLMDYIINNHHSYVKNTISQMIPHLEKVSSKHGEKYPELYEIKLIFEKVAKEMISHMQKEEDMLFHVIRYLIDCQNFNERPKMNGFKTIKNLIDVMEDDHANTGKAMERIRLLTNRFAPPADACNTFKLTYKELEDFEKDLHIHVHLENNILFPKAIQLEIDLLK